MAQRDRDPQVALKKAKKKVIKQKQAAEEIGGTDPEKTACALRSYFQMTQRPPFGHLVK